MFDLTRVTMESKDNIHPNYMLSPNMIFINSIHLSGSNYASVAQAVEVRKNFHFLIDDIPFYGS